jgi:hypothetical protein
MIETVFTALKRYLKSVNWTVLIFLILILNVKLVVKIAALLVITVLNRKKFFQKEILTQGFILFYFSMIVLAVINLMLYFSVLPSSYPITSAVSIGFWLMSAFTAYNLYVMVDESDIKKLNNTLTLFFILNVACILFNFLLIQIETGVINPYEYKGLNQKYYISTGDSIRGISFDNSVTTAVISSFAIFYFLYRRYFFLSLISMWCFLLLASNITNFVFLAALVFIFFYQSDRVQKSIIVTYVMLLIVFMVKVSPHNREYVVSWVYRAIGKAYYLPKKDESYSTLKKTPDSLLSFDDRRKKSALISIDSLSAGFVKKDTSLEEREVIAARHALVIKSKRDSQFYAYKEEVPVVQKTIRYASFVDTFYSVSQIRNINKRIPEWTKPGKWIGFVQLVDFFKEHPSKIFIGNGAANFSSHIAFKATALNIAGRYPERLKYVNPDFMNNHLYVYLYYHTQKHSKQAALNIPDSVYGQLLGEYGLIGFLFFVLLYTGYFLKRMWKLTYSIPLLIILLGSFFFEYWFELLSIVVLFEFMFLVNLKESKSAL